MKKSALIVLALVFCLVIVTAQNKIEISTIKESFSPGEKIAFKISLYDFNNNLINDNVAVNIEDPEKISKIEKNVASNEWVEVDLGEKASYGYWKITARYPEAEANKLFVIEIKEAVEFRLDKDVLSIENIGNTRYTKDIQIVIGEVVKIKSVDLGIKEKTSFRLIAPDGIYDIKVTDGKTTLAKTGISLTGKAVGVMDEKILETGPGITGGLRPEDDDVSVKGRNLFVYLFITLVVGAGILLVIERFYRKKFGQIK